MRTWMNTTPDTSGSDSSDITDNTNDGTVDETSGSE